MRAVHEVKGKESARQAWWSTVKGWKLDNSYNAQHVGLEHVQSIAGYSSNADLSETCACAV